VQWIVVVFYHLLIFWFFPLYSNVALFGQPGCIEGTHEYNAYGCYSFKSNNYLLVLYLIVCYYFTYSAYQIRLGLPDMRKGSCMMVKEDSLHMSFVAIFQMIPFLMELKTCLDWWFTKTSLTLIQWLQLTQFHYEQFKTNVKGKVASKHKLGDRISPLKKTCTSVWCVGIMLIILIGPFFLNSNNNIVINANLVEGIETEFNLNIADFKDGIVNKFPLFSTSNAFKIRGISETEYNERNYSSIPATSFFKREQI